MLGSRVPTSWWCGGSRRPSLFDRGDEDQARGWLVATDLPVGEHVTVSREMRCQIDRRFHTVCTDGEPQTGLVDASSDVQSPM